MLQQYTKSRKLSSVFRKLPKKIFGMPPPCFSETVCVSRKEWKIDPKKFHAPTPLYGIRAITAFFRLDPSGYGGKGRRTRPHTHHSTSKYINNDPARKFPFARQ